MRAGSVGHRPRAPCCMPIALSLAGKLKKYGA